MEKRITLLCTVVATSVFPETPKEEAQVIHDLIVLVNG